MEASLGDRQAARWGKYGKWPFGLELTAAPFVIAELVLSIIEARVIVRDMDFCNGLWWEYVYAKPCRSDGLGYPTKAARMVPMFIVPVIALIIVVVDVIVWRQAHWSRTPAPKRVVYLHPIYSVSMAVAMLGMWAYHLYWIFKENTAGDETISSLVRVILKITFAAVVLLIYLIYMSISAAAIDKYPVGVKVNSDQVTHDELTSAVSNSDQSSSDKTNSYELKDGTRV